MESCASGIAITASTVRMVTAAISSIIVNPGSSLLPGRRWNLVRFIVIAFALVVLLFPELRLDLQRFDLRK
jgi:hypothetical protein